MKPTLTLLFSLVLLLNTSSSASETNDAMEVDVEVSTTKKTSSKMSRDQYEKIASEDQTSLEENPIKHDNKRQKLNSSVGTAPLHPSSQLDNKQILTASNSPHSPIQAHNDLETPLLRWNNLIRP